MEGQWILCRLGKYLFSKMVEHTFILNLHDLRVEDHIMPKLMEPILPGNPRAIDIIEMDDMLNDFMVLLYIHKYMGVNKV